MTGTRPTCSRVTGTSATGPGPRAFKLIGRLGGARTDGRWDVICDSTAKFVVNGQPTCERCLPAVVDREMAGNESVAVTHADAWVR